MTTKLPISIPCILLLNRYAPRPKRENNISTKKRIIEGRYMNLSRGIGSCRDRSEKVKIVVGAQK